MTDYTNNICPDGKVRVIHVDSNWNVLGVSVIGPDAADSHLSFVPNSYVLSAVDAAKWDGGTDWTYPNNTLTKKIPAFDLDAYKADACLLVDSQAEAARLKWISPGSGQSMAYQAKADQAAKFLAQYTSATAAASANTTDWNFLAAEIGITADSLYDVAVAVTTLANTWAVIASQIEGLRLGAKKNVNAATTQALVDSATSITWPVPS